ncbi:MAG TPA: PP2C family protein-serine/threonine phosphatase, partial [Solirubrobacteraceae bacterium]
HPLPLRLRDGRVEPVPLEADPPFGTVRDHAYRVQRLPLEPGDRLFFFTDGILERNATDVDVAGVIGAGAEMHPREAVQHLIDTVLDATGRHLNDDATALCVDWHGGPERDRTTSSGADQPRSQAASRA